jgi:hypothetical protein
MTMRLNISDKDSPIWIRDNTSLNSNYYNFSSNYTVYKQNVQDGYTLIGGKDAGKFIFKTS